MAPLYILVHLLLLHWFLKWNRYIHSVFAHKAWRIGFSIIYLTITLSPGIGFLLGTGKTARFFKLLGNYCFGISFYAVLIGLAAVLIRFLLHFNKKIDKKLKQSRKASVLSGIVCLAVLAVVCGYGMMNARHIRTTVYDITVDKTVASMESLNVVLVADLHMGYNIGPKHIAQMVEKINRQDPDVVVIAGDIFDNEYEALDQPDKLAEILRGIQSRYGVYAAYGNHDIQEKILAGFTFHSSGEKMSDPKMDEFLKEADITLLRDEYVMINDEIYLYGRPDKERPGRGIIERKSAGEITETMDLTKPILVVDHEPSGLDDMARAKVDVDFSGHTHDGQMFPGTILTNLMWENPTGYLKKDQMHSIVTSGVGIYGPYMRVGTQAEICKVTINFS